MKYYLICLNLIALYDKLVYILRFVTLDARTAILLFQLNVPGTQLTMAKIVLSNTRITFTRAASDRTLSGRLNNNKIRLISKKKRLECYT